MAARKRRAATDRKSAEIIDDLPAPVLPTIPTRAPPSTTKEIALSTSGSSGR
jgi:hypothetical protein